MQTKKWIGLFLVFGLLVATQSFADDSGTPGVHILGGKATGDHHSLVIYYEAQAQAAKSKAQDWDFAADYYEKFPSAFTGKMTAAEHVAHLRAVAEDFRKEAQRAQEQASKHHSLMRKDIF